MTNLAAAALDLLLARERLPSEFVQTIDRALRPLTQRIAVQARSQHSCFVVGLCGPQGSGKSTMTLTLQMLLEAEGIATAALSLDDIYFTREQRATLAQHVHPLLQTRGVPGTHDVALGAKVIDALGCDRVVRIPSFNKACDDRRLYSQWKQIRGPVQVIIFEGWCVGAVPQPELALTAPVNAFEQEFDPQCVWRRYVNRALTGDYQALFRRLDALFLVRAPSFEMVYGWRLEQERKLRERIEAEGGDRSLVMSDQEVRRFISHYERLTRHILEEMPARADVVIDIDATREVRALTHAETMADSYEADAKREDADAEVNGRLTR